MHTQPYTHQLSFLFDKPVPALDPVNPYHLQGQNKRLYEHLAAGNTISFLEARKIGIEQLSSRVEDLTKRGIKISSTIIRIGGTQCKEYRLDAVETVLPREKPISLLRRSTPQPSYPREEDPEGEIWTDIAGYEGLYQISDFGRVKSFKREPGGVILKNQYSRSNGLTVGLIDRTGRQKVFKVHKLVANAFLLKPEGKDVIIHKNCDPTDNNLSNLKWGTKKGKRPTCKMGRANA